MGCAGSRALAQIAGERPRSFDLSASGGSYIALGGGLDVALSRAWQ
ncbi:hypothetical protein DB30_03409 [Enhygromyxa salina]|uniref:Uncharacterized protein n=1 Tax=Enhygromyxa salina TaxID=215803 RepID=A0A0C2DCB2_9BACT|nr:hypothetical protein DB30_03409 [Enhygromyxa salina]